MFNGAVLGVSSIRLLPCYAVYVKKLLVILLRMKDARYAEPLDVSWRLASFAKKNATEACDDITVVV